MPVIPVTWEARVQDHSLRLALSKNVSPYRKNN
jgi:hypothetical protein